MPLSHSLVFYGCGCFLHDVIFIREVTWRSWSFRSSMILARYRDIELRPSKESSSQSIFDNGLTTKRWKPPQSAGQPQSKSNFAQKIMAKAEAINAEHVPMARHAAALQFARVVGTSAFVAYAAHHWWSMQTATPIKSSITCMMPKLEWP